MPQIVGCYNGDDNPQFSLSESQSQLPLMKVSSENNARCSPPLSCLQDQESIFIHREGKVDYTNMQGERISELPAPHTNLASHEPIFANVEGITFSMIPFDTIGSSQPQNMDVSEDEPMIVVHALVVDPAQHKEVNDVVQCVLICIDEHSSESWMVCH